MKVYYHVRNNIPTGYEYVFLTARSEEYSLVVEAQMSGHAYGYNLSQNGRGKNAIIHKYNIIYILYNILYI